MRKLNSILIFTLVCCFILGAVNAAQPFSDVPAKSWYAEAVNYCVDNGLMTGISTTKFNPDGKMTRAMVVTILWRMDGEPSTSGKMPFTDCPSTQWYYKAVKWAYANNITNGVTSKTFCPDNTVTREQMATFFYNYAKYLEARTKATYGTGDVTMPSSVVFKDWSSVHSWARNAFIWAYKKGIITGTAQTVVNGKTNVTLSPLTTATRAQGATMIMKMHKLVQSTADIPRPDPLVKQYNTDPYKDDLVAYFIVKDGEVVDLTGKSSVANAAVDGDYFSGGKVSLAPCGSAYTIEVVAEYNRESSESIIADDYAYYGGVFALREIANPANIFQIKQPFQGGVSSTHYSLKGSVNRNARIFPEGNSFWAISCNKDAQTLAVQLNDEYTAKPGWSEAPRRTFSLSADHKIMVLKVYNAELKEKDLAKHYEFAKEVGVVADVEDGTAVIGHVTDGITGLGSAAAFQIVKGSDVPQWVDTPLEAGTYTMDSGNGLEVNYTIRDYEDPDTGIDNSKYESVHIVNAPETIYSQYKYAFQAIPYPFNINHNGRADQFDVSWSVSDESVAVIIDGLLVPKKAGTVIVTATLKGTSISDSCTVEILEKPADPAELDESLVYNVPKNYTYEGYGFSNTDYESTTRAIYGAIDEAYQKGYRKVVFPVMDFYAVPIGTAYFIPTGMTVVFPEGSTFHMMPSQYAETGYVYFRMGWPTWLNNGYFYDIPKDKATIDYNENGVPTGYYCDDAHLIMDVYYGEFYTENATMQELATAANEFVWGCDLLCINRNARYCTVEIARAECPTGFFITLGGKIGANEIVNNGAQKVTGADFVHGRLDDIGEIVEDANWISTTCFIPVTQRNDAEGTDIFHKYFLGDWEHQAIAATQRLYDILWYNADQELLQVDRWQYMDETYTKPADAKYCKISVQQTDIPEGTGTYLRVHPSQPAEFCEVRNTAVINGADGLCSVTGATANCWIHDNYISGSGLLSGACWGVDLEDGWLGMRHTVIERNIFRMYAHSMSKGDYYGPDAGTLALSAGNNTFVVSNFISTVAQEWSNTSYTHLINNVMYGQFSSIVNGVYTEIRAKGWAHCYYNYVTQSDFQTLQNANGVVYYAEQIVTPGINVW